MLRYGADVRGHSQQVIACLFLVLMLTLSTNISLVDNTELVVETKDNTVPTNLENYVLYLSKPGDSGGDGSPGRRADAEAQGVRRPAWNSHAIDAAGA